MMSKANRIILLVFNNIHLFLFNRLLLLLVIAAWGNTFCLYFSLILKVIVTICKWTALYALFFSIQMEVKLYQPITMQSYKNYNIYVSYQIDKHTKFYSNTKILKTFVLNCFYFNTATKVGKIGGSFEKHLTNWSYHYNGKIIP